MTVRLRMWPSWEAAEVPERKGRKSIAERGNSGEGALQDAYRTTSRG